MDAQAAWSGSRLDDEPGVIKPSVQTIGIYAFLISFSCVYYLSNTSHILGHYDLGWHLAAGDLIRSQGHVPFQDPWAFTLGDRQWYNLSWLWDVIASMIFQHAGFGGLMLLVVACGAAIVGSLTSLCLSRGASAAGVCIAAFSACVLYPSFATTPNVYLSASPNMATMLFSVMFYGACLKRERWWLLPVLMVAWVNLHGGFVIGFFIIGVFGAVALLKRDWAGVRTLGLTGTACFLAIFINPLGWHIYDGVVTTLGHFVQHHITEWLPYSEHIDMPGSIPAILYILVFVALELRDPGVPCPIEARLLSWIFLVLGFHQFRYMGFFFLFSAVPLALHLDRLLPKWWDDVAIRKALLAAGIAGACALPLTFLRIAPALGFPDMLSEQDARYLQAHFANKRVLNNWTVGGFLIHRTQGKVPMFVDGRAATAYPDELLRDYFKLTEWQVDEAAWDMVLAKYRIDAVLWVKAHDGLRRFLVDKRGWKEDYTGLYETVYVRP